MSDRSEEVTESRETRSTEELLEETDRLLSGDPDQTDPGTDTEPSAAEASPTEESDSWWRRSSSEPSSEASSTDSTSSRLSVSRYFSPKAFLALVGAIGAGLLAGDFLLPFGGRPVGMFAVAFLVGLLTSRRRYLENAIAGVSVGAVTAFLANPILSVAGSGTTVIAIGVAAGLVASVGGYYFGRDLRDGLSREI
ncbi:DUF4564 domain-containing protein [Natrialbaceae archaeon A-gly3]